MTTVSSRRMELSKDISGSYQACVSLQTSSLVAQDPLAWPDIVASPARLEFVMAASSPRHRSRIASSGLAAIRSTDSATNYWAAFATSCARHPGAGGLESLASMPDRRWRVRPLANDLWTLVRLSRSDAR